ncbi:MAG: tetratricopeptide repeat protein [Bacteroidia bacterium]|nr:tetratricopeptide repeat protein [Bacteroidia bacterium]
MVDALIKYCNKKRALFIIATALLSCSVASYSQADRKMIREGNREYGKEKYSESEISYRKALDKNKESSDAVFNTGDALYRQKKYEDAGKQFADNHNMNDDKKKKSASLYNLGNSFLMANKVQESIEAYKGSLKLDPDNKETKYNLAYAQDLLKQQQEQQQNKQDQDKKEQKQDQNKDNQNKDQKDNKDQQKGQQQKQQEQQGISKEDAERVLNALANDEKNVQEKVKLAKAQNARVRTIKNW